MTEPSSREDTLKLRRLEGILLSMSNVIPFRELIHAKPENRRDKSQAFLEYLHKMAVEPYQKDHAKLSDEISPSRISYGTANGSVAREIEMFRKGDDVVMVMSVEEGEDFMFQLPYSDLRSMMFSMNTALSDLRA